MGTEKNDYSDAAKLYSQGFTVPELAAHYRITTRAMYDVLKRVGIEIGARKARKIPQNYVRRTLTRRGKR